MFSRQDESNLFWASLNYYYKCEICKLLRNTWNSISVTPCNQQFHIETSTTLENIIIQFLTLIKSISGHHGPTVFSFCNIKSFIRTVFQFLHKRSNLNGPTVSHINVHHCSTSVKSAYHASNNTVNIINKISNRLRY